MGYGGSMTGELLALLVLICAVWKRCAGRVKAGARPYRVRS